MLHAAMFVYSEIVIRHAGIDLMVLCASMGALETSALGVWNLGLLATYGPDLYMPIATTGTPGSDGEVAGGAGDVDGGHIALLYGGLTLVNALHSWAFFNMLERVGAVSSAVMKGVQMVCDAMAASQPCHSRVPCPPVPWSAHRIYNSIMTAPSYLPCAQI